MSLLRSLCVVLAISGTAAASAACSSVLTGRPVSGDDRAPLSFGPNLTVAQLQGVLLDVGEVNAVMKVDDMAEQKTYDTMPTAEGATYSDEACIGVVFNTLDLTYRAGTYTAVRGRVLAGPGARSDHRVDEGVVTFADGSAAQQVWTAAQRAWGQCAGRRLSSAAPGEDPDTFTVRTPVRVGDVMTTISDVEGGDGIGCSHALAVQNNAIIDVVACAVEVRDQALDIVNAIAAKFPK